MKPISETPVWLWTEEHVYDTIRTLKAIDKPYCYVTFKPIDWVIVVRNKIMLIAGENHGHVTNLKHQQLYSWEEMGR